MTIPLDRLPAPAAVVDETFEQLRDAAIADLTARVPDYDPRATDPAVRLLEVGAYVRLLLGGRVNDAVRGVFLATATAADLDNVAAAVNVARLPGENDDALRSRAQLAWEALSAAGPTGAYRFHALSVPGVRDVRVTSPDPGEVLVGVLSHAANGAADQALLDAVSGALNASSVRPVTDDLTVSTDGGVGALCRYGRADAGRRRARCGDRPRGRAGRRAGLCRRVRDRADRLPVGAHRGLPRARRGEGGADGAGGRRRGDRRAVRARG